jgi:energy-coupling factor transport system ATP-binding protein
MPLIEVENLTVHYPNRRNPTLRGVSFSVEAGESVLLLGPSGGGKSTLALCLNGLIPQRIRADVDGTVHVGGLDTRTANPGQLALQANVVFQDPDSQLSTLTVADEVAFGLESLGAPPETMDARIDQALGKLGLLNERSRRLDQLSMGEKQRLGLACALAMDTPALVLDEPTSHLDPETTQRFYRELGYSHDERTLILIEHKLDACIHLIDRVLLLNPDGRLVGDGPPREVFSKLRRAIDEWGMWAPQVTEVTLRLDQSPLVKPPLRLDETVEFFKTRLPLTAASPEEPHGTPPLHAPSARAFVVDKLSYTYPKGDAKALDEISLSVPAGDFLALLGPNGSGKTTLATHLAGILEPPPGKVKLFGFDVNELAATELTERVGYVFQNPEHQFVTNRAGEELAYSLRARTPLLRGRRPLMIDEAARVEELLSTLGLTGLDAADPYTLSLGQKRRLSLSAMLAVNHRLLVLDEPTLGQDRRSARNLMQLLQDLNRGGVTIVVITQDMRLVAGYTRNSALLIDGKLAYHGPTRALFHQDILLIQAGLWPPPLFDLTLELQRWQADFPNLMTVDDYVTAFEEQLGAQR